MPTWEQAHLFLIRDVGIFWLLRESVPLCLLGDMATFISLGTAALSPCCQPAQGYRHPLAPWGQEPLLLLLPAWGHGHLLAPWGKIISASRDTRIFWLLRNRILSVCLGTWPLSTAWGQECSLLTASLLGNMAIFWIPEDQITFPCMGTGSLRTYMGTRTFLLARGQGHLLGDRVLLCVLGDMGIF